MQSRRPELFGNKHKSLPTLVAELKQLTVDYAKQETIDPVKGLGQYLLFGLIGSILLGLGLVLWVVAILRALQNETGTALTGNLSWVPYLVTILFCALVGYAAFVAIGKDKRRAERRKEESLNGGKHS